MILYDNVRARWRERDKVRVLAVGDEDMTPDNFERLQEAENHRPVLIRVKGPGMVHAGVNRGGKWIRMYDVPLQEVSPGVWEASLVDPEVNEFTFIWYDPNRSGSVHWEGKNYLLPRRPVSKKVCIRIIRGASHVPVLPRRARP